MSRGGGLRHQRHPQALREGALVTADRLRGLCQDLMFKLLSTAEATGWCPFDIGN
jgi:hypothetical protein